MVAPLDCPGEVGHRDYTPTVSPYLRDYRAPAPPAYKESGGKTMAKKETERLVITDRGPQIKVNRFRAQFYHEDGSSSGHMTSETFDDEDPDMTLEEFMGDCVIQARKVFLENEFKAARKKAKAAKAGK